MTDEPFFEKLQRLANGGKPRVLDLFSGCGGISLGFDRAGFSIDAAIEIDPLAAKSHSTNFHKNASASLQEKHAKARDITQIEPEDLAHDLELGDLESAFDVIVGGPPCQAYARVGRAKLRDVAQKPDAFKIDPRANLYLRYLYYVKKVKPLVLLMENVPDIMNFGGHNIAEDISDALSDMGYCARYTLANASRYGVPQMRDRVFIVAVHRSLKIAPSFPKPTRHVQLPPGYGGTRSVALKNIDLFSSGAFLPESIGGEDLPYAVTAKEAISDLPPITLHLEGKLKRGARRFDELIEYPILETELDEFAKMMRQWPGFTAGAGVYDHVIRSLPRDTFIFREMKHGDEYPAAHTTAVRLYEEAKAEIENRTGQHLTIDELEVLRKKMVPPYPVGNFPNRWCKLRPDQPSRTLLAHIGKDTYSHIHYSDEQARTISVREAARLQSFPDGFKFEGTMNPAFRQIGNAVPPVMAWKIAEELRKLIEAAVRSSRLAA